MVAVRESLIPERREDSLEKIVVVGCGPAGMRFAESVSRLRTDVHVQLLNDEPFEPYDRVRLSSLLARELAPKALYARRPPIAAERIEIRNNTRIIEIDRSARVVVDRSGRRIPYDKLVIATGSRPRVPPIPGVELPGVFVFRNMRDAERLLARQMTSRTTVVIGGGVLGLESARAMRRFNTRVHVIEHERHLMFNQLDAEAASGLQAHIERLGIRVHIGESVLQIVGSTGVRCVRLRSGIEIDCDTIIIATGITPNSELAREAGIAVGRGIRVNDQMQSSDPSVYAIGECCEHRDRVYGLVGPGLEQAGVAASHVAGLEAGYRGSIVASSLKIVGCPVFSMGDIENSARDFRVHVFRSDGVYRRLNVHRGRLIGALGIGEWDVARLRTVGLEGRRVWPWQLRRFRGRGDLWHPSRAAGAVSWPPQSIVCNCRGVTRAALGEAIEAGADTLERASEHTGAGTVCGSCRPLVAALVVGAPPVLPVSRPLCAASVVALVVSLAALFVSLPYATSMTTADSYDVIWTSSLYKQISGYSLLMASLLASLLAFRKRVRRLVVGRFSSWQIAHVVLGVVITLILLVHTGFRFGANSNLWLMASFTSLLVSGGLAGVGTALAQRLATGGVPALKRTAFWAHVLLLWPLPALLGAHIFKSYYF